MVSSLSITNTPASQPSFRQCWMVSCINCVPASSSCQKTGAVCSRQLAPIFLLYILYFRAYCAPPPHCFTERTLASLLSYAIESSCDTFSHSTRYLGKWFLKRRISWPLKRNVNWSSALATLTYAIIWQDTLSSVLRERNCTFFVSFYCESNTCVRLYIYIYTYIWLERNSSENVYECFRWIGCTKNHVFFGYFQLFINHRGCLPTVPKLLHNHLYRFKTHRRENSMCWLSFLRSAKQMEGQNADKKIAISKASTRITWIFPQVVNLISLVSFVISCVEMEAAGLDGHISNKSNPNSDKSLFLLRLISRRLTSE